MRRPRRPHSDHPSRPHARVLLAFVALAAAALVAPAGAGAARRPAAQPPPATPAAFDPTKVDLTLTALPGTFSKPVLLTHAGDGSGRRFVVEQTGRIRVVLPDGSVLPTPLLDLSGWISTGSEQGLLGLAFHPSYATNRKLYVSFTNPSGTTAINEYRTLTTDPNRASGARRILSVAQPYSNHNGGHIAFGPDGFLYIGLGDGGSAGDPGNRAQNLNTLLGKMLRIDVNGTAGGKQYRIPSSNPYVGRSGLDEIWSYGLRNPWRWSFDRTAGGMWVADVGQNKWEEVNRATAGAWKGGKGVNYGWRQLEGRHCFNPPSGCSTSGKLMPLVEYAHGTSNCSVTGGYVYRGSAYPVLTGGYLYGDFCSGRIWTVSASATLPATGVLLEDTSLNISSFGEDQSGNVYVLDLNGKIYKIGAQPK